MEKEDVLDFPQFRKHLKEMKQAIKEGMIEDEDHPEEVSELVAAMERLEKELGNKNSQQLLADFFMVYHFISAYSEEDEDDDLDDYEDDEDEEYDEEDDR